MESRLRKVLARMPRSLLSAAVLAVVLLLAVAGVKNYRQLQVAHAREEVLRERLLKRRQAVEELDRQLVRLRQDPVALERLARENLGMAYADDLVFILPDESLPAAQETISPGPVSRQPVSPESVPVAPEVGAEPQLEPQLDPESEPEPLIASAVPISD